MTGEREPMARTGKARGMRGEGRGERRVIEGLRVIFRPRMAVSTCLRNLPELNI